jgi:NTP pyrophosphatase (non-canonical NTP hydrolase)
MKILDEIVAEVVRATSKYPTWPTDPLHALAVLGEEYGELNKAILQLTYEPFKTSAPEVRMEAIQTAAMAIRLALSLEHYVYVPCNQHEQEAV